MTAIAEHLRVLAADLHSEEREFYEKNNFSAGRRARKILQEIRKLCGQARNDITAAKNSGGRAAV